VDIRKKKHTEFNRVNKPKCPSEDASVPVEREKKAMGEREGGREGGTWERKWMGREEPDLVLGERKLD
jgi:hypothetical protein